MYCNTGVAISPFIDLHEEKRNDRKLVHFEGSKQFSNTTVPRV